MGIIDTIKQELRLANYTTKIIVINVLVFLLTNILFHTGLLDISAYLGIPSDVKDLKWQFYSILSYMFLHMNLGHIFFNMLVFYFAGRLMEDLLGHRRMVLTYIFGGIFGGIFFLLVTWLMNGWHYNALLLGASASVLAVFISCAVYMPEMEVSLYGIFNIRLKWLALILFVVTTVLDLSVNTGGKLAHLGGAVWGLFYAFQLKNGKDWYIFRRVQNVKKMQVVYKNDTYAKQSSSQSKSSSDQETLDFLLDKIKKSGYDSLSKSEKELLNHLSRKI
jgi:membrane associated rhomboid family serine protease